MSGPIAPVLALGVVSYANNWKNTGNVFDVKPLLFAGIAGLGLELFAAIPGMEPVATLIGWSAFIGLLFSPNIQNPTPIENVIALTGGK
jgi:hypothetical protein